MKQDEDLFQKLITSLGWAFGYFDGIVISCSIIHICSVDNKYTDSFNNGFRHGFRNGI